MASLRRVVASHRARWSRVRVVGVTSLTCLGMTLAACGGGDSDTGTGANTGGGSGKPTETLTWAANVNCFEGLDLGTGVPGGRDLLLTYEPLIRFTPQGELEPGLATSWEVAPGNKSITLQLREDARFSDGTPVTAEAVKTWLDYRNTIAGPFDGTLGRIEKVEVLGRHEVRITLVKPNPVFPRALSPAVGSNWGYVANPKAVAKAKANPRSDVLKKESHGAGAYVLVPSETVPGDHCTYVPNRHYFDQSRIRWAKVVTKNIPDSNTVLAALKTGQVDVGEGDSSTAPAAKAADLQVVYSQGRLQGITFFDKGGRLNPALADVRVRQALNYAVDRETITRSLFGPDAQPTSNPNPTSDGDDPETRDYYPYDPERARRLLADAGYPNGFTLRMSAPGAWIGPFKTTPLAQAVAGDLAKVGVRVELSSSANITADNADLASRRFEARSAIFGTNPTWVWYPLAMQPGGYLADQHGFVDPVTQRLWEQASVATEEEAAPLWKELVNRTIEQAYFIGVLSPGMYTYFGDRVGPVDAVQDGAQSPLDWAPAEG
ncbi:MAG TPA: ABC transporter substrate-binding protein [Gemmatimonadaceae bacterium]|nr:ABC transporter substrate-binding protein [Gemmatimonadaceae bacterium]